MRAPAPRKSTLMLTSGNDLRETEQDIFGEN